jgi:mannose-6-phosphate isomerase-like protein (cupin superfamily)
MNINEIKEQLSDAKKNTTHFLLKGFFKNTPSWEDIFEHLSYEYFNKPDLNFPDSWIVNGGVATQKNQFYAQIRDSSFYKQYNDVLECFNNLLDKNGASGAAFLDLISNSKKVSFHNDPADQFHWQIKGKSIWQFKKQHNDDNEQVDAEIEVEEGDVIFLPDGIYHSVSTKSARCGITVMYSLRKGIVANS